MNKSVSEAVVSKVPAVTLGFWIIKILATTLGETGGDTVTMTWLGETTENPVPGGYLIGTAIFGILLILLVFAQIKARKFNPWLYWATIVASTTCGTTLADFADRSLGIGYPGGSLLLFACVHAVAVRLGPDARHGRRQQHHRPARRDFLLDHDHLLPDARDRARRLDRRCGARLFGRRAGVRRGACGARDPLFHDADEQGRAVLGRLHPDPPARRDGRRFPRQAGRQWRARLEPAARIGGARHRHRRADPALAAAARAGIPATRLPPRRPSAHSSGCRGRRAARNP